MGLQSLNLNLILHLSDEFNYHASLDTCSQLRVELQQL